MNDALLMTIEDLTAPGIKVLDGIAGAAKTSHAVQLLKENAIPYVHLTSTNRLKRDILSRFGGEADTIASGLFDNLHGFYTGERTPGCRTLLIDEPLQTSPRVFDWAESHTDYNVIFCTDSRQMLSPGGGQSCLKRLNALKESASVYNYDVSHRPIDQWTADTYSRLYSMAEDDRSTMLYVQSRVDFDSISVDDLPEYSPSDAYLCHTNEVEEVLYDEWALSRRYDLDLIPKGSIARVPVKRVDKYPILPQNRVRGAYTAYWQVSNICSVYRYQGSEVEKGNDLWFFIPEGAQGFTLRELYTMVTRAKTTESVHIRFLQKSPRSGMVLTSFQGLPILTEKAYPVDHDVPDVDSYRSELKAANDTAPEGIVYTSLVRDGRDLMTALRPKQGPAPRAKITPLSMTKHVPEMRLRDPELFYHEIDRSGYTGVLRYPLNPDYLGRGNGPYEYALDLSSAYPHALAKCGTPDGTTYRPSMDGAIRFYLVTGGRYFQPGTMVTGVIHDNIACNRDYVDVPIGSCDVVPAALDPYSKGLLRMATESIESKADVKSIHWGWFQKPYLSPVYDSNWKIKGWARKEDNRYFLLPIAIMSEVCYTILRIKEAIYGTDVLGETCVDCVYFNGYDVMRIAEDVKTAIPGYDFRIVRNEMGRIGDDPIVFQSFADLPHKKDVTRKKKREAKRRERAKAI